VENLQLMQRHLLLMEHRLARPRVLCCEYHPNQFTLQGGC